MAGEIFRLNLTWRSRNQKGFPITRVESTGYCTRNSFGVHLMKRWVALRLFILSISLIVACRVPTVFGAAPEQIDLDFKNADLKDVLRALSVQAGVTMVIDDSVKGSVTLHLTRITFAEALNVLVKTNGLAVKIENNVYYISRLDDSVLRVEFAEGLLSVEARHAKLVEVLAAVAEKAGLNILHDPEVEGAAVTVVLRKLPLETGIQVLLEAVNCTAERRGDVYYVRRSSYARVGFSVIYREGLLSVDARNIPLAVLAKEITDKTGQSVVPEQNLNPNISVYFKSVPVEDGLQVICDTHGMKLVKDGAVWRILKRDANYRVKYQNGMLSVEASGVDITILIAEIMRQSGKNIVLAREVRGPITIKFDEFPLERGLALIAESQGWIVEPQANYFLIKPNPNTHPNLRVVYDPETNLLDLDVKAVPLAMVLNEIGRQTNTNVLVMAQVNWTVGSIGLKGVTMKEAFDYLLQGTSYSYRVINGVYIFGDGLNPRPEMADFLLVKMYPVKYLKAEQVLNSLPSIFPRQCFALMQEKNVLIVTAAPAIHDLFAEYLAKTDVAELADRTEIIRINNLKAEDVLKLIPNSIPKNDIVVVKEMNALAVTGSESYIEKIKGYIAKIDQVNPMIVFDVMILSISNTDDTDWQPPATSISNGGVTMEVKPGTGLISLGPSSFFGGDPLAKVTLLLKEGKAKLLANPTLTAMNGHPASFRVSTKMVYTIPGQPTSDGSKTPDTTKTLDVGIFLTITPWVSANNQITMEIKPTLSEVGSIPQGASIPETKERSTETIVRVQDKQTVVISGLRSTSRSTTVSKVPLLGDIPLIGYLFRTEKVVETQDEFVILITPYLVYDQIKQAAKNQEILEGFGERFREELRENAKQPSS